MTGLPANAYHFITTWDVPAPVGEIEAVLGNAPDLPRWWPSVYLDVAEVEPGDAHGVGRVVALYTKGYLPYTLHWTFRVTEATPGRGFALEAWGDFVGRGMWMFEPQGDGGRTRVTYDWKIAAEKGILKRLSRFLKPLFSSNHRWAMARGEESLLIELARRRAGEDAAILAALPRPPGPTFPHNLGLVRRFAARYLDGTARPVAEDQRSAPPPAGAA